MLVLCGLYVHMCVYTYTAIRTHITGATKCAQMHTNKQTQTLTLAPTQEASYWITSSVLSV